MQTQPQTRTHSPLLPGYYCQAAHSHCPGVGCWIAEEGVGKCQVLKGGVLSPGKEQGEGDVTLNNGHSARVSVTVQDVRFLCHKKQTYLPLLVHHIYSLTCHSTLHTCLHTRTHAHTSTHLNCHSTLPPSPAVSSPCLAPGVKGVQ